MAEVISGAGGGGVAVGNGGGMNASGVSGHPNLRTSDWPVGTSFASTSSHQQTQSSSLAANTLNAREVRRWRISIIKLISQIDIYLAIFLAGGRQQLHQQWQRSQ